MHHKAIASFDWRCTPLGPLSQWPPALRIAVDMLLLSPFPCALVWGPEMTLIHNDAYQALLGSPGDHQGGRFDMLWARAWDSIGSTVFKVLQGQGCVLEDAPLQVERAGVVKTVWVTGCYSPIRDDQGRVAGFLHALIDTTASVETSHEWRELAQSFEARLLNYLADPEHTWQLSPDVMLMLDVDLRLRMANPTWQRLLGWRVEEQFGVALPELFHPADRTEARLALMALLQGKAVAPVEARIRHCDGHYRWFRCHGVADQSMPMLVARDITDDRQAIQLRAEAAMRESQRMETVVKVAGGLAHEMNNVLSGVGSSLELLERRIGQGRMERVESYVQMAHECAQRAIALTQNLLAFARSQPLSPRPLDVNRLMRQVTPLLQQSLGSEMRLQCQLDVAPWPVLLDADQLRNALLHLCSNARDASLGRGVVSIRTANERLVETTDERSALAAGDYVAIYIEDNGHGMSQQDVARAFEPFFTTKPPGQGVGLGLPMVHGFVRQSGGQIWIESKPDQGTRVVLMFPRYAGSLPEPDYSEVPLPQARGERLLLVDDEINLRGVMKEALVEHGFEVCDVPDANSALGQFRHGEPFDLVITDIGLPGGFSGSQVARALRLIKPEQKILFITGFTEDPVEQVLLDEPGTALLLKPFSLETLVAQVLRMLQP
ncbi:MULTISPECIES: PAS domain-containing sensor histidine kinase [unclassified Pseudomonas]|uniref:hybrid sensor histidine kinase/response regulator n=1 Tax=unclassified Pseudomonas TaxID=196821 RepID=UPI002449B6FB|nr:MULTISPECIES: PAS domain-containing sensor histidine kinase [unclassified Pseudomonas]MDH0301477.1 ATP-binding protein [Pseudomonas sp. GD04091]MDH1985371.1 ATP-binding protein [Pseudomonas sp. GD03689]